ncbi:MAG: DHA2 family efflux MFS transporter permease subunit [Rhodobiaceae bacterium]|nr:DHA2 family efflux MFS transporter permease subunit [Rhodobiaceae bacterium]
MSAAGAPAPSMAGGKSTLLVSIAVMLATIMVIIDMTVVNVNLAEMMGGLGATADQITWVLTSYIVAEAVTIPLGGILAKRYGRKRVIFLSVTGFVITSALCGQAGTLSEMVIFRLAQGVFGASIIPVSQSVMIDAFPPKARGRAMAIWGIGIMLGPILGPTLGGYISEHLSWRWVFYINLPVGLLNLLLIAAFLDETEREQAPADWLGALFLITGVGALQTVLDQGNQKDWFQSNLIVVMALISAAGLIAFVLRSHGRRDAILRIDLLQDRNLATASFMMMAFGLGMFGTIALQPLMLSELFGYPPETIGMVMAPRGMAAAVGMFTVAGLINRLDPRYLVTTGLVLSATGSVMMGWIDLNADAFWIIVPSIVQGLGMGMIFVPLSTLAFATLERRDTDFGSGIFNLSRTIGSSIGISVAATILTHKTHVARGRLADHLVPSDPNFLAWLEQHHLSLDSPQALHMVQQIYSGQAAMLGFINTFTFIAVSFAVLAPLVLLLRRIDEPVDLSAAGGH